MRCHYDSESDAFYLRLDEATIVESEEVRPGVVFDCDERNEVVGIEILGFKRRFPNADPHQIEIFVR
jgi:uncharacterized protein YuzE